jgi:hypothetical protein
MDDEALEAPLDHLYRRLEDVIDVTGEFIWVRESA